MERIEKIKKRLERFTGQGQIYADLSKEEIARILRIRAMSKQIQAGAYYKTLEAGE